MQRRCLSWLAVLLAATSFSVAATAGAPGARGAKRAVETRPVSSAPARARCTETVMHPISVHVTALDPIAHGVAVRLLVSASSAVALDRAEVRLVSTGGALNQGPTLLSLGRVDPGKVAVAQFTVGVPATGARQYVQFSVTGQGPNGPLTRGGCYNLLPDGPLETGRLVVTPQGAHVYEVRAGRID